MTVIGLKLKEFIQHGLGVPILIIILLSMMILPLPPFLLDVFFSFNLALSLVILLACVYCQKPLDFAIFPTILLVSTLLRLGLNIASTRVVLLHGHLGTDAAGKVIEAFGEVVVGGNYAVGFIVFLILIIINFVVVTKGAGRIAEVSARFVLDAMPGKQMSIDADLNAGLITQDEARARRKEIANEADFYGAMDGASKFVRGDAIAGILIVFINILGGLLIGVFQHQLPVGDAAKVYTLLSIGDGLVAQIPALLLSTAAAMLVTRNTSAQDVGKQVFSQLFNHPNTLFITGGILAMLGLVPGMPHLSFIFFGGLCGVAAYYMEKKKKRAAFVEAFLAKEMEEAKAPEEKPKELNWEDVPAVDIIGLEVGYRLIPLVDAAQGGKLMDRIKGVRKKLSQDLGFLVPAVHIRDNLELPPNNYRLTLMGVVIGDAEIFIDKLMAINPGQTYGKLEGIARQDPAFGLEATWIAATQREQAQTLGYTVVDPSTVIATHISHILQTHAAELIGHDDVQQLLDRLSKQAPKLVEGLIPTVITIGVLVRILQGLLKEGVAIRDMRTITETIAEYAPKSRDPDVLVSWIRVALSRQIIQNIQGNAPELPVVTLSPELEHILQNTLQPGNSEPAIEPGLADKLQRSLLDFAQKQEVAGMPAVLLVPMPMRAMMVKFSRLSASNIHVLSYQEIPDNRKIKILGAIGK